MPRHFSPCGEVLLRKQTLVMRDPARHYPYIAQLHAPIRSALLVPFARRGRLVGTLWVLAHTERKNFTTRDSVMIEGFSTYVAALLDAGTRAAVSE
jgi:GAF domain-containing protein